MEPQNIANLWTFQSEARLQRLLCDGFLLGNWDQAACSHNIEVAYRYMSLKMAARGLQCGDNPPVWAWHSCGGYQKAPDNQVARMMLSDHEIIHFKIMLLSLKCPTNQFLASDYSAWCDFFYFAPIPEGCVNSNMVMPSEVEKESSLFDIDYYLLDSESLIQATLPVIRKEYVVQVRRVIMDKTGMVNIIHQ